MNTLPYFTERAVLSLRAQIGQHLDWYYGGIGEPPRPPVDRPTRHTNLAAIEIADHLKTGDGRAASLDPVNAIGVYRALSDLRPREAADERFWAHLCHGDGGSHYVRERWLTNRPEDQEHAARQVRNHFFAKDSRALIRDNALSRLWWLGYIAQEVAPDDPLLFLNVLLHKQDIRSALIERPFLSMNHDVLRAIYAVMLEHWNQDRQNSKLFVRDVFRDWMVRLNRRGGVVLLDAIPSNALDKLLREEAVEALSSLD